MASNSGQSGGAEQRRYVRLPLNLDGYLGIAGHQPVLCTVRDFCVGGMFITVEQGALAGVQPQSNAILYFALMVGGEKQDYQVRLQIARVVPKGLGVSFFDADPRAVELLGQLAQASAPPPPPETAAEIGRAQRGFAAEFAAISAPLGALVDDHVKRICTRFLERVDDVLFLAARDADNNVDQNRYIDGQRELRGRQTSVRDGVPKRIAEGLAVLGNPMAEQAKDPKSLGLSDLSLVDKDEFEEFLVISEMVSELEPEFSEALFALSRRFSYLANRDVDLAGLPIGPSVMCNALAEELKGLQSHRRVTARVYKVLHEVMSGNLGRLYDDANRLLVEHRVLPVIEKDKPVARRRPPASPGFNAEATATPADPAQRAAVEDALADLMPGPENYQGRPAVIGQPRATGQPMVPSGYAVQAAVPAPPANYGVQAARTAAEGYPPVQAVPPAPPPGYAPVQGAAPPFPSGPAVYPGTPPGVQAAPPVIPAAASVPPYAPAGPVVTPVAPTLPAEFGVAAPTTDGLAVGAPAAVGGVVLPAGWASSGVRYAMPTAQQGYSTAQAQLALRRQLQPPSATAAAQALAGDYSRTQVLSGLSDMQEAFARTGAQPLLDVEAIKQRIVSALINDGAPEKGVGGEAADALEVVANLFSALLQDALVAKGAKTHLARLQPTVHKAALLDPEFFASTAHPVRQLVDRIALVRDGRGEQSQRRQARVEELLRAANQEFRDDVGVFQPMLAELEQILAEQRAEYAQRVQEVVAGCEQQQRLLEERRGQSMEATDAQLERSDLPEEWNKWLERSRALEVGQQVTMNATSSNPTLVTLVWKEARNNLFVFVDEHGNKANTLTSQQVAMYLRRGIIRPLDADAGDRAIDRAMFGVVDHLHGEVEAQATRDLLTGFLARRFFVDAVDAALAGVEPASKAAVCCQLSIENLKQINDDFGTETGDGLLAMCAAAVEQALRGKDVLFGRLGGAELGVFWPAGGVQAAYKKLQAALPKLTSVTLKLDDDDDDTVELAVVDTMRSARTARAVQAEIVIGVTATDDSMIQADGLLGAAREACDSARTMGAGSIYVAGSESEQRRVLEQMVSYANKALERGSLILLGQRVTSLVDAALPPALHVAISARDRADKPIPSHLFAPAMARVSNAADIDLWGFRQTLAWMQAHEEEVEAYALVIVPLSSASMKNEDLPQRIMGEFMESPVPPGKICFEIPDRDAVENLSEVAELVNTMKEFGCRFVLDEFGSGHQNYDYIKRIAVDYVTVKTAFVNEAQKNPKDFAMAKSINELVHFMGKKTMPKQERGAHTAATMREIGIDFLYDLTERAQLAP